MSTPIEPTPAAPEQEPVEPVTPAPVDPQAPEPEEPTHEPQAGPTDPWADPDVARREIEKLRREAAASRTKAKDRDTLAAKVAEYERAQLSEQERLQAELAEARQQSQALQTRTARAELRAAAKEFKDPEDAVAYLKDRLGSYVDAQGEIDEAQIAVDLADLLERKPHLAKAAPAAPPAEPASPRRPAPDRTQAAGANPTRNSTPGDEFAEWFTNAAFGR
ncbi:hypothetical protein [Embleya sp. NPDC059237]|uniref:hypothetical protein n=1 Tax=Embleya sp. NPDC059237 TaxID=3346784 RepID=UPI0036AF5259